MKFELAVIRDGKTERKKTFKRDKCLVGRHHGDLPLDDGYISTQHALIYSAFDGQLWVRDLRSKNGVYVNENRVELAPVRVGDIIRVGRTRIKIVSDMIVPQYPSIHVGRAKYTQRRAAESRRL